MALTNTLREPRRELTESGIGLAIFGAFLYLDWHFAVWFHEVTKPVGACPVPIGLVFGVIVMAGLIGLLFLTHAIGEWACGALANRGIELRPKQRY